MSAERARFEIAPKAPYSLSRTAERFTRFPEVVDRVEAGAYRRLLVVGGRPLLLTVTQRGAASRPRLQMEIRGSGARSPAARERARGFVGRALGADHDLPRFYRAFRDDPLLGGAIRAFRGLAVAGYGDAFEALATTILAQQVNLAFAHSIRADLARAFGRRARFDGTTFVAFPSARRLAAEGIEGLRRFRLSAAKARALHGVARAFLRRELDDAALRALPDEGVIERLTALRGVGRWTAETTLLRGLGRRDAFPGGDLGVVKYLAQGLLGHSEVAREAEMRAFAERWRPYRSYALVYAYAELRRRAPS